MRILRSRTCLIVASEFTRKQRGGRHGEQGKERPQKIVPEEQFADAK